eukprot:TRINITY_DN77391_c0_g1_i1.p1 TRINITY_DN77391_c0_g1~~TRINITY_DN77391_c0_g1_i1.p1  ORF type:complete len:308 (-),score=42.36 TRINITY_DN77391_c0_g1_i1:176-1057(-)
MADHRGALSAAARAELDQLLTETRHCAVLEALEAWQSDPSRPKEGALVLQRMAAAGPLPQTFDWPELDYPATLEEVCGTVPFLAQQSLATQLPQPSPEVSQAHGCFGSPGFGHHFGALGSGVDTQSPLVALAATAATQQPSVRVPGFAAEPRPQPRESSLPPPVLEPWEPALSHNRGGDRPPCYSASSPCYESVTPWFCQGGGSAAEDMSPRPCPMSAPRSSAGFGFDASDASHHAAARAIIAEQAAAFGGGEASYSTGPARALGNDWSDVHTAFGERQPEWQQPMLRHPGSR